ncbi:hypothetical protein M885DRAFT_251068 [Pelagophyceae sp. CCMP2097]|nr:hypothetical protein M885DRAFT_251068 [Pelagophyceae sp. CCMP2097]
MGWAHSFGHITAEGISLVIAQPDTKVCVEFDGATHFFAGSLRDGPSRHVLDGTSVAKERLLRRLGWDVIRVPYFDWMEKRSKTEREEYLRFKIKLSDSLRRGAAAPRRVRVRIPFRPPPPSGEDEPEAPAQKGEKAKSLAKASPFAVARAEKASARAVWLAARPFVRSARAMLGDGRPAIPDEHWAVTDLNVVRSSAVARANAKEAKIAKKALVKTDHLGM